jgi:hypothetical protein
LENSNLLDTVEECLSPTLGWDLNYNWNCHCVDVLTD